MANANDEPQSVWSRFGVYFAIFVVAFVVMQAVIPPRLSPEQIKEQQTLKDENLRMRATFRMLQQGLNTDRGLTARDIRNALRGETAVATP